MDIPEQLTHYLDKNDRNLVVYHNHSKGTSSKAEVVLKDAAILTELRAREMDEIQRNI